MPGYHESVLDRALAQATPVYPVNQSGRLPPLVAGQFCYLLGHDGLYVFGRSNAVAGILRVAELDRATGFGPVTPRVELLGGRVPVALLAECVTDAVATSPTEWAGAITWEQGRYHYRRPVVEAASAGAVRFRQDSYNSDWLAVDLHSHGEGSAYFSATDDKSDAEGIHVAVVVGRCAATQTVEFDMRLSICGWFTTIAPEAVFGAGQVGGPVRSDASGDADDALFLSGLRAGTIIEGTRHD